MIVSVTWGGRAGALRSSYDTCVYIFIYFFPSKVYNTKNASVHVKRVVSAREIFRSVCRRRMVKCFSPCPPPPPSQKTACRVRVRYAYTLRQFDLIKKRITRVFVCLKLIRVIIFKNTSVGTGLSLVIQPPGVPRSLRGFRAAQKNRSNEFNYRTLKCVPRRDGGMRGVWGFSDCSAARLSDGKQREMYTSGYVRTETAGQRHGDGLVAVLFSVFPPTKARIVDVTLRCRAN